MRHTLEQEIGLNSSTAANVLKKLTITGRLVYVVSAEGGPLPIPDGTGPVISMPLTQSADGGTPLITAVSPALIMGIVDKQGSGVGDIVDTDAEAAPEPATGGEYAEGERTHGYWRIG